MFSTQQVGRKIVELRKSFDMTQMELADQLGISFQAVSNWERGNSMPDISKLPELAAIFNVSLDELLGGESDLIKSAIHNEMEEYLENNEISQEEVSEAISIFKPSQIETVIEKADISKLDDITCLLPFLKESDVKEFAEKAQERGDTINAYLPFLEESDVKELARKSLEKGDSINAYLPFLEESDVKELARKSLEKGDSINAYLPFLEEGDVKEFAGKALERGDSINAYLPFLEEGDVKELAGKALEKGDSINAYLPFLEESDVKDIALLYFKS